MILSPESKSNRIKQYFAAGQFEDGNQMEKMKRAKELGRIGFSWQELAQCLGGCSLVQ